MKERIKNRKRAHSLVFKKTKELDFANNHRHSKPGNDIVGLKEGTSDPSLQLVIGLKKLLQGTVHETEIDQYLTQPFIDKSPNQNKNNNSQQNSYRSIK